MTKNKFTTPDGRHPGLIRENLDPGDRWYESLTIISEAPPREYAGRDPLRPVRMRVFNMVCDCGNQIQVYLSNLRSGKTQRCMKCRDENQRKDRLGRKMGPMSPEHRAAISRGRRRAAEEKNKPSE